jgi:hypothetical protein
MDELDCMRVIDESFQAIAEEATRIRIASWIAAKYGGRLLLPGQKAETPASLDATLGLSSDEIEKSGQIPGIAKLSSTGDVQLTVRDFKARSANDAALRLVHVLLWATKRLTGRGSVSSKAVVVPALRKYRCYDGNTRTAIAGDKGLVRDGDELSLDFHAEQLAAKFSREILDASTEGKWRPGTTKRRAARPFRLGEGGAE